VSAVLAAPVPMARPMREGDLSRVLRVEREAYEFPWSDGIFRDCLRVGYCCWVVERENVVEGHGILQIGAGEAHILNLCVRPGASRQGLGRMLLERLLEVARSHGAENVVLEVRPSNDAARRLYAGAGFAEVGMRRGYYPRVGGREDALILARVLGAEG
jgi:ribosomal-protein-alanine N-acetyltransferase